jgi:hypothetical protein
MTRNLHLELINTWPHNLPPNVSTLSYLQPFRNLHHLTLGLDMQCLVRDFPGYTKKILIDHLMVNMNPTCEQYFQEEVAAVVNLKSLEVQYRAALRPPDFHIIARDLNRIADRCNLQDVMARNTVALMDYVAGRTKEALEKRAGRPVDVSFVYDRRIGGDGKLPWNKTRRIEG